MNSCSIWLRFLYGLFVFLFFVVLDKILERLLPVKNRTNEHYHQIQHIRFKLGTNFYTHIFDQIWIKFAKKMVILFQNRKGENHHRNWHP